MHGAGRGQVHQTVGVFDGQGSKEHLVEEREDGGIRADPERETFNGGIGITGVTGRIEFEALNGGVHLTSVGGDVVGRTTNGGVQIELDGDRWRGEGLDVTTTNGGVTVRVPSDYSARLETGTVNGGIDVDFPVQVQGRIGRSLSVNLGEGGRTVRAVTTNGGVRIVRGQRSIR